jgi:NADH-quinone oxidoreductase subunit N
MPVSGHDLFLLAPVLMLLAGGALAVVADLFGPSREAGLMPFISLGSIAAAAFVLAGAWGRPESAFGGAIRVDGVAVVAGMTVLAATALSVLMSLSWSRPSGVDFGEFYALMLTAASGALLLTQSGDLMTAFLGIEVLSISVYCLVAITRDREKSIEAAIKYFVLGAFATGFLLFGIAFLYGAVISQAGAGDAAGSQAALLSFEAVGNVHFESPLLLAGLALFLIGIAFKIGAVPFHAWTPDAYEGAPAPVTGFMASVVKIAAFTLLVRAGMTAFPSLSTTWASVLCLLAAASMIVGNVFALTQGNLKRLLAYSSIGHTGYILVGVIAASESPAAGSAVLFYLATYAVTTVGAFGLLSLLAREGDELENVASFDGLAARRPAAAAAMTIFMASLAGIPPTGGFMGKFVVFREAIQLATGSSPDSSRYMMLAVIGIATSMISAYYYLKIVVAMYMSPPAKGEEHAVGSEGWGAGLALILATAGTMLLGTLPQSLITWCGQAITELGR